MEDTARSNRAEDYHVYSPCSFIRGAVNSILKCLGFDHESKSYVNDDINDSSSCSKEQDNNSKEPSCYGKDDKSSYTATPDGQLSSSDPPPITMDPPDDPPMDLARVGRTPPRPRISTGRDPQTNSTSS